MIWREGTVRSMGTAWPGAQEVLVELIERGSGDAPLASGQVRALAYTGVVGRPVPGDRVLLSAQTLVRGLGTGGYAMVVALPDRLPADPLAGPGHVVKARYTPLQTMVLGVDEQESPWHEALREADDLVAMPVVVADLHSALPAVVAGARGEAARRGRPPLLVAYVMTDGGALPATFSRALAGLRQAGWVAGSVTAGQAYGGDLEAVNVHTALLAARHVLGADLAVVSQGPGNLGTGTRWGFSGVAAGEAINAASVLGGRPVGALRVSGADARERHRGLSHHSLTAYGRVALRGADLPLPTGGPQPELWSRVAEQCEPLLAPAGVHRLVPVPAAGMAEALDASPVRLSTMGRGLAEDPAAFLASAVAGAHAATLALDAGDDRAAQSCS